AALVPVAARALALGDPRSARHALPRAQLRLRALRPPDPGRSARRPRPLVLALRAERRGAREPGHDRALREALRALRLPERGDAAGLRAGRELRRAQLPAPRPRAPHRARRPRGLPPARPRPPP